MREYIEKVWLPQSLAIGIPYETFGKLNPRKIKSFDEAYRLKIEDEYRKINYTAWLHGQYVMSAIGACLSKDAKYPEKPLEPSKEQNQSRSDAEGFEAWAIAFNMEFEKKQKLNESVVKADAERS